MKPALSSLYQAVALDKEIPPLLIGERANTTGSKKFREFLLAGDDEGCLSILKAQERGGADILDLSVAYAGRNEKEDMVRLLKQAALRLSAPLMIDSTQPDVIEEALKNYPGRPIVNSVNLEKGEAPLKAVCRLVRRYGAAVVGLTIDEEGMVLTAARKLAVAERIAAAAFECGLREEDLFFDPLTFTLASGDSSYAESARETLAAVALIRDRFPKAHTVLGVSNVSFGLPPRARRVLNSVFLAEAVSRGLGAAIIDPSKVMPLAAIEEPVRRAALDLIENRRPDALALFTDLFVSAEQNDDSAAVAGLSPEERLRRAVIDGDKASLEEVLPEVLTRFSAEEVLNHHLIGAMKEVGERFGQGEMLLPFVLQSAETLRCGVDLLKPHLTASAAASRKPVTVLLATVAGDVHDIGKNLVGMILENNGFEVRDIGVKADVVRIMSNGGGNGAVFKGHHGHAHILTFQIVMELPAGLGVDASHLPAHHPAEQINAMDTLVHQAPAVLGPGAPPGRLIVIVLVPVPPHMDGPVGELAETPLFQGLSGGLNGVVEAVLVAGRNLDALFLGLLYGVEGKLLLVILAEGVADLAALGLDEGIYHAAADYHIVHDVEKVLDDGYLGRYLGTADDGRHRMLRSLEYTVDSLDLAFHHIAEHLVIREILGDERSGGMCPVCRTECVVDIAVRIGSELLHEFLLAFLYGSLCGLLLLVGSIFGKAPRLAFLLRIETEILQHEHFTRLERSHLLVGGHAVVGELHRNPEQFLYPAEDMLERKFLCNSLWTAEVRHNDEGTPFVKHLLQCRDGSPDPGVVRDFEFFIERNIEIHPYDGFLA